LALFTNREKWGFSPWGMPFFLACMIPKSKIPIRQTLPKAPLT